MKMPYPIPFLGALFFLLLAGLLTPTCMKLKNQRRITDEKANDRHVERP